MQSLLQIAVTRLKYTDEYNFVQEDDFEEEFQQFRKEVKVIVTNLMLLVSE